MQIFYAPDISGNFYTLDRNESRHLVKVLRFRKGSEVKLIDGKGNMYEGVLQNVSENEAVIEIIKINKGFEKKDYFLHLAVSPLKNPERFEWLIEKCVEIGVDEITPVICRNSEKKNIKEERIRNIIISAMKQSLKAYLPVLNQPIDFAEFLSGNKTDKLFIAHCNKNIVRSSLSAVCPRSVKTTILIGPEGDFTEEEIRLASEAGAASIHLGTSRLRSETAAISACHSVYFINQ